MDNNYPIRGCDSDESLSGTERSFFNTATVLSPLLAKIITVHLFPPEQLDVASSISGSQQSSFDRPRAASHVLRRRSIRGPHTCCRVTTQTGPTSEPLLVVHHLRGKRGRGGCRFERRKANRLCIIPVHLCCYAARTVGVGDARSYFVILDIAPGGWGVGFIRSYSCLLRF